jgi:selenocysteine lyase/cysteine desulfurase
MNARNIPNQNEKLLSDVSASRRSFLKTLGITTAGLTTLGLTDSVETSAQPLAELKALATAPSSFMDEWFWLKVRMQFVLKPDLIYLNTGTEGAMPRIVLNKMRDYFRQFASFPYDAIINDPCMGAGLSSEIDALAAFFGADKEEIVITTNTIEGLGWVSNGLDLAEGDEVLSTTQFRPYSSCWQVLIDRKKITLTEVELPIKPSNKQEIIDLFEKAITPRTKVMTFCHINYTNGLRMPVKELCDLAKQHGIITLIDGAHAPGMITFDLHEMGCDFYAGSLHKWLCGPPGTGILYLRKDMVQHLWPTECEVYTAGAGTIINCDKFNGRGQLITPAIATLLDAMDLQNTIGRDTIQKRILALNKYCKERIIDEWGPEKLLSPAADNEDLCTGLVAFNPFETPYATQPNNISAVYKALYAKKIAVRTIGYKEKHADEKPISALRISTHLYNNYDQIDTAIEEIKEIIKTLQ